MCDPIPGARDDRPAAGHGMAKGSTSGTSRATRRAFRQERAEGDRSVSVPYYRLAGMDEPATSSIGPRSLSFRRDRYLEHAVTLVREQVVGFFDLVEREPVSNERPKVCPSGS